MRTLARITIGLCLLAGVQLMASEIDGTWVFTYETEIGAIPNTRTFKTDGESLILVNEGVESVVGTYKDGQFNMKLPDYYSPEAGFAADLIVRATLKEGKLSGEWEFAEYTGPVTATRKE